MPIEEFFEKGVILLLFVWLFFDSRKEAKERESRLIKQINEQSEIQSKIVHSLEKIEEKINDLGGKINGRD